MPTTTSIRRLDHLVLPARDLDAQGAFYQRLGFRVGGRNVHPWGTENRIIQFDGCFLELITIGEDVLPPDHAPRNFSFGAHVRNWLAQEGDGMSMLVIDSPDGRADAHWFNQAGIGLGDPFRFGRKGRRPDGSEMDVAFTLGFARAASMPDLAFFACQQHNPDNFWNAANQLHENTALGVGRVVIVQDRPLESAAFLKSFAGGGPAFEEGAGLSLKTRAGVISVWTPDGAKAVLGADPALFDGRRARFGAVIFDVASLDTAELSLRKNNVPHRRERGLLLVPSGAAFGVLLAFEERTGS